MIIHDLRARGEPMKLAGKMLEMIGMVIVLVGFLYGVEFSLIKFELTALVVGSAVFYAGWMIEKKSS